MSADLSHQSVLARQAVNALITDIHGCYVDATFGRGGHSQLILQHLSQQGQLLALDQDPQAIQAGQQLAQTHAQFTLIHDSFAHLSQALAPYRGNKIKGILFDLGVSSPQLDNPQRGFSFLRDGPLDMRMNPQQGSSAAKWLAQASEADIRQVLKRYGEEPFAKPIARAIVTTRQQQAIVTTGQLAAIVTHAHPAWPKGKHPATRTFQAIRIFINQELAALQQGLIQALELLAIGGRLVVISFHSLEDRQVKVFFRQQVRGDNLLPTKLPVMAKQLKQTLKLIGKRVKPDKQEITANPRARSAIMRVAEKIAD
jgi:16S rRNA (cytosine1402-N4)-methyltransferase